MNIHFELGSSNSLHRFAVKNKSLPNESDKDGPKKKTNDKVKYWKMTYFNIYDKKSIVYEIKECVLEMFKENLSFLNINPPLWINLFHKFLQQNLKNLSIFSF